MRKDIEVGQIFAWWDAFNYRPMLLRACANDGSRWAFCDELYGGDADYFFLPDNACRPCLYPRQQGMDALGRHPEGDRTFSPAEVDSPLLPDYPPPGVLS